jgi:hypothetical protein
MTSVADHLLSILVCSISRRVANVSLRAAGSSNVFEAVHITFILQAETKIHVETASTLEADSPSDSELSDV